MTAGVIAITTKAERIPATSRRQRLFSQSLEMLKGIVNEALEEILDREMNKAPGGDAGLGVWPR